MEGTPRIPNHYCLGVGCPKCWESRGSSSGHFSFNFRNLYRQEAPPSCRKAPDTTTGVQLANASVPEGVYPRAVKDKSSGTIRYKYEPRFTPPREKVHDGTTRKFNRLSLGEYHTPDEAKIVLQIARFYYNKGPGCVELDNGPFKFFIPPMNELERGFAGEEKRKWVTHKAKQVYADLGIQKQNFEQLSVGNGKNARSIPNSDIGVLEVPSVSSVNALEVPSCPAPLPPCDVVVDYCGTLSAFGHMVDELLCPDSTNFLPQQSSLNCEMHYIGLGLILGNSSSPQADGVTQGIQGPVDGHLNPRVDFQQGWDLVGASESNFFDEPSDLVLKRVVRRTVYASNIVDLERRRVQVGYRYEPRFTPPREKVHDGTMRSFGRLPLGEYCTPDEAKIVLQIAWFYHNRGPGCVVLDDGQFKFFISPMNELERGLAGEEKKKWVLRKAKQVYADLGIQKRNFEHLSVGNGTGARSSHDSDIEVLEVPSVSSAAVLEVSSCPVPLPPCNVVNDYCETLSGIGPMIDELLYPDSTNFLPQQSSLNCEMHYLGFDQILEDSSSPQVDGVTQDILGSIDAHLSPPVDFQRRWDLVRASGSNFFAEPSYPVLQQLVDRQKQQLVIKASQIVDLEHRLCESEIRNSVLQQEIERLTSQSSNGSLI